MTSPDLRARSWYGRLATVIDHIEHHLDQELDAAQLARMSGFSLHHFHRVFRGATGESVMGFVRRLRLEQAANQLRYGESPVTDIAFDVGYRSHEAFTRAFRARFGEPPRSFRESRPTPASIDIETFTRNEPRRVAIGMRHVGPYEACGSIWQELTQRPDALPLLGRQLGSVGIVYDDPEVTSGDRLRYDACLVVPADSADALMPKDGPWIRRELPAGTYAIGIHRGPYDTIFDSYVALIGGWLPRRPVELAPEPVVEVYVVGPEGADPQDYVTEICVRLSEAGE